MVLCKVRDDRPSLCFSKKNVLITSGPYECSYNQRSYVVFWKFVLTVLITRVLITRVDCTQECALLGVMPPRMGVFLKPLDLLPSIITVFKIL